MLLTVVLSMVPAAAAAQDATWSRPYVAQAQLSVSLTGDRQGRPLAPGQELELEAGGEVTLRFHPKDQWGRPFPAELAGFYLVDPAGCSGLVDATQQSNTSFRLRAGNARGRCNLRFVAAGNLNLEWALPVKVTSVAKGGYNREQAEYIATRLYRALLAREPDPEGFRAAVAEIQRNRLGSLLDGMLASPEFAEKWRAQTPVSFLEQVYQGLLGRRPDSEGVRRYLREVERGRLKAVLADIIHSPEFEESMLAATRGR